jgi:hypothetical protein
MYKTQKYCATAIAAHLICFGAAQAQNADWVSRLKTEANFPSWPTGGAVQGFNFQPAQYLALAGFSISSDTLTTDYLGYGVFRTVTLSNGSGSLTLKLGVGVGTGVNGHELFLRSDFTDRDLDLFDDLTRGDLLSVNPVSIGNLNFIPLNANASNLGGYIGFMRNNVFCVLADNVDSPSGVNFSTLANELDSGIQAQSGAINYAPPVVSFSPVSTTLSASAGGSTTATVSITDPTDKSGPIQRQFLNGGTLDVQDSGGPSVTISATTATGSFPLTLVAINAFLQFNTYTVTFTVIP